MSRFLHPILLIPLILSFIPSLPAQAIEDPGPHSVGWRDVTFVDQVFGQGTIVGRIYYPALTPGQMANPDPSSGPYPLVAFLHGWTATPSDYDQICTHVASWGFVVASTGTETMSYPDLDQFAKDTQAYLHWVDIESDDPGSWLYNMAWEGDWAASGHSMGGGTLALLIGYEPRITTLVGLQSASSQTPAIANIRAFTGNCFQVAGSVDTVVIPRVVHLWFEEAESARRNIYFLVEGMGHRGCMDEPGPNPEPLPHNEQMRLQKRVLTGLLCAEVKGDEFHYADLLGEGIVGEPVIPEADCGNPPYWAQMSAYQANSLVTGLGGRDGGDAILALSLLPASIPTHYGLLEIDPFNLIIIYYKKLPIKGCCEALLQLPQCASGVTIFLQGVVMGDPGSGQLTRSVELVVP